MRILSVVSASADKVVTGSEHGQKLWPGDVRAITFVIAVPDVADGGLVAHGISTDGEGRGLFSIAGKVSDFDGLMVDIANTIAFRLIGTTRFTGPVGGRVPPPPPPLTAPRSVLLADALSFGAGPGPEDPMIAFARAHRAAIDSP